MKQITASLARMKLLDARIRQASETELEAVMQELVFPGVLNPFKFGLPLALSMLCALCSFAMPQPALWMGIFYLAGWPGNAVFAGIVPGVLLFCLALFTLGSLAARGYYLALRGYLVLLRCVAAISTGYLLFTLAQLFLGHAPHPLFVAMSVAGVAFSALSFTSLNTPVFGQAVNGFLHNRAWRKAWVLRRQKTQKSRS
ncbi:hypothetical protein [Mangrovibacter plantisponsor]|nr:hypothetical protein [Mangrovibacter plantisponsor]